MDEDAAGRRRLVADNLDLVHRVASRVHDSVRPHVDMDELVSLGTAGLLEAAARYDTARRTPFRSFAYYRIRGAIYDGLRKLSHLPRRSYRLLLAAGQADAYLEALQQRPGGRPGPSTRALLHRLHQAVCGVATVLCVTLDGAPEAGGPASPPQGSPDALLARARIRRRVSEAVRALPARERHLIEKCYFEGKTLVEAGEELGLSRSWASRLHARAVDRLRRRLAELGVEHPDDG